MNTTTPPTSLTETSPTDDRGPAALHGRGQRAPPDRTMTGIGGLTA